MPGRLSVAVVDAQTSGNVGTIARAMKNFGVDDLLLVDPPDLDPGSEAYGFAGRAREDVLANATELSFEELATSYHTIAFTSLTNQSDTKHVRYPVTTVDMLGDRLQGVSADTALVFGRERIGLTNDELGQLDELCTIPANPDYPVMNLGQAATIALYELRELSLGESQSPDIPHERAPEVEIEALYDHIDEFLDRLAYPPERRGKTDGMFRRVLGRADLTSREVSTFHGVLQRCEYCIEHDVDAVEIDE